MKLHFLLKYNKYKNIVSHTGDPYDMWWTSL